MVTLHYYEPENPTSWSGRIDDPDDINSLRWHQLIEFIDLRAEDLKPLPSGTRGFCFLGYCCDRGVKKNLGRSGANKAPLFIRKELSNLPRSFDENAKIFDGGNITCTKDDPVEVQSELSLVVEKILSLNLVPIILGGGHDLAYGHFRGILQSLKKKVNVNQRVGIISFDAHFDLRSCRNGPSSGTMFAQIAEEYKKSKKDLSLLYLGVQKTGNTLALFKKAEEVGAQYILAKDIEDSTLPEVKEKVDDFIARNDQIYLTICTDVFSSAFAPGVSAPQPFGMHPEIGLKLIKHIFISKKVVSFDIAEILPRFDEDNRTAKLAAIIIFAVINKLSDSPFYGKE